MEKQDKHTDMMRGDKYQRNKSIDKKQIEDIVKKYPKEIIVIPRVSFEEQMRNHLLKHFGLKVEEKKEEVKTKEVKRK